MPSLKSIVAGLSGGSPRGYTTMRHVMLVLLALALVLPTPAVAVAQAAPHCPSGQTPRFVLGFAALKDRVGAPMGEPLECEHPDPASGDTHQRTSTGLAYYRPSTNTAIFTDGWRHWALRGSRLGYWEGQAADPPATAFAPRAIDTIGLPGRIVGSYNVRSHPLVAPSTLLRTLGNNTPVRVEASVRGEDGDIWYRIGEGEFVHSEGVRLPRRPPRMLGGRWLDVDLTIPAMITAYEGDRVVYSALTIPGTAAFQTPTGTFKIVRRVADETMDSATVGIPRSSPDGYYLEDVLYTQYFTWGGASLHYNWWKGTFGYPGSHGCLGLNLDDAKWFWEWASIGTLLNIHN